MSQFSIAGRMVGNDYPVYFIADIAANHDGDLNRAKDLISLAKEAGADAAKFQHFRAPKIVSDYGFKQLGGKLSHQKAWDKSVYDVYADASIDWNWTMELSQHCKREGIHFFSSPYDIEAVDHLQTMVPAYKIGSGDIDYFTLLKYIAQKNLPVLLATGASTLNDVIEAVSLIQEFNNEICIMQCNTNYTGNQDNFKYISLNVLKTYALLFPSAVLGLSDHTPGHTSVLGSVALGARIIEKHFTDDNDRKGPDHPFSMNPTTWRQMVDRTHELELSLGTTQKRVENNERESAIVQRRCIRAASNLKAGSIIDLHNLECLRPATPGALTPKQITEIVGKRLMIDMDLGQHFTGKEVE